MSSYIDVCFDLFTVWDLALREGCGLKLTTEIAQSLIATYAGKIDFGIGICDCQGIVLADTAAERVGTFDESTYVLLSQEKDLLTVAKDDHYLGATPGLRFVLQIENQAEGVACLSGDPEGLLPILPFCRAALEQQLTQELAAARSSVNRGLWDSFCTGLLEGGAEPNVLQRMAAVFQLHPGSLRVCILCVPDSPCRETEFRQKMLKKLSPQDIAFSESDGKLVLFHEVSPGADTLPADYRARIDEALAAVRECFEEARVSAVFSVGSLQNDLALYYKAYQHALWVIHNSGDGESPYFYDHISEFLKSLLPAAELHAIFSIFVRTAEPRLLETCLQVLEPLIRNNYNLVASSGDIFMHKNTLIAKLGRIKSHFGVNPYRNAQQREFIECFYYYLRHLSGFHIKSRE